MGVKYVRIVWNKTILTEFHIFLFKKKQALLKICDCLIKQYECLRNKTKLNM